jgi:hypothetical protein
MVSERTFTDAGRALVFLLLYGGMASALAPRFDPYLRVLVALLISVTVFAVGDILPAVIRGNRPLIDTDSRLYSVRGVVSLILIILVTAVTIDWLRAMTALSEVIVTLVGFTTGVVVVLGPIVGYYWRRSGANRSATEGVEEAPRNSK